MTSILGYHTYLTQEDVDLNATATAATGHGAENVSDWRLHNYYQAATGTNGGIDIDTSAIGDISPDYCAVMLDSPADEESIITVSSGVSVGTLSQVAQVSGMEKNRPVFINLTGATAREYWRVQVENDANPPVIRHIALGQRLTLPKLPGRDFVPPIYAIEDEITNNRSESGAFVGRSVKRKGARLNLDLHPVESDFVREDWEAFMQAARCQPFYYLWDTDFSEERAFCWTDVAQPNASYISECWMRVGVNAKALVDTGPGCSEAGAGGGEN